MTSLIFRALDTPVIQGRADDPAFDDGSLAMTMGRCLAESAAIAGGLAYLGVTEGTRVAISVSGGNQILAVLACARLGAIPDPDAAIGIVGDPVVVRIEDQEHDWSTVNSAGRLDPMPAPEADPPGYAELLLDAYGHIFEALLSGRSIT